MGMLVGGFFSLVMALGNLILQAAFKVILVFVVLFLIGVLYPFVAQALGMPYMTVWELGTTIVHGIRSMAGSTVHVTY